MTPLVSSFTAVLSALTALSDIFIVALIIGLVFRKKINSAPVQSAINFFSAHAVFFAFIVTLAGVASSLFYSEVAGFPSCSLCVWQRMFLYPQILMLGWALIRKRDDVAPYSILLSSVGGMLALYHSYIQLGGSALIPCSANVASAACTQRYFVEFGYVTIPAMALTGFLMIILFMTARIYSRKESAGR